jgi:hypothetical protein
MLVYMVIMTKEQSFVLSILMLLRDWIKLLEMGMLKAFGSCSDGPSKVFINSATL